MEFKFSKFLLLLSFSASAWQLAVTVCPHSPVAGILISTLGAGCLKYLFCYSQCSMSKAYFGNRPILIINAKYFIIFIILIIAKKN